MGRDEKHVRTKKSEYAHQLKRSLAGVLREEPESMDVKRVLVFLHYFVGYVGKNAEGHQE